MSGHPTKHPRPCELCGTLTTSPRKPGKPVRCSECGLSDSVVYVIQMRQRSGPAWDAFMASKGPAGRPPRNQSKG